MRRSTALIHTATCCVARGLREDTGEQLTGRQLAQRVGWLSSLVADIGQATIDAHWDRTSLTALTADETPSGRKLSAQGAPPAAGCGAWPRFPPSPGCAPGWRTPFGGGRSRA
jgi:hypothetical protein